MNEKYDREERIEQLEERKQQLKKQIKQLANKLAKLAGKALKVVLVAGAIAAIAIPTAFFRVISLIGETLIKFSIKGLKYELGFTNKETK